MKVGGYELGWSAKPFETKEGQTKIGYQGLYRHSLFDVEAVVSQRGQFISEFRTRFVSSKRVREPRYER